MKKWDETATFCVTIFRKVNRRGKVSDLSLYTFLKMRMYNNCATLYLQNSVAF